MLYVPVPHRTLPLPLAASMTAPNSSSFSLWVSVGDSPVEPATTRVSEPWSKRYSASVRAPSRSSEWSSRNGVTMAVTTAPNLPAMLPPYCRVRRRAAAREGPQLGPQRITVPPAAQESHASHVAHQPPVEGKPGALREAPLAPEG